MLYVEKFALTNPLNEKNKQIAPSLWQLLYGQGVWRIFGFKPKSKCHGVRFGILNVENLHERKTKVCEVLRKRRADVYCMQEVRWKGRELVLSVLKDKGINCAGQKITIWRGWLVHFYDEMASEENLGNPSEIIFSWGILMGMWENMSQVLKVYGGMDSRRKKWKIAKILY